MPTLQQGHHAQRADSVMKIEQRSKVSGQRSISLAPMATEVRRQEPGAGRPKVKGQESVPLTPKVSGVRGQKATPTELHHSAQRWSKAYAGAAVNKPLNPERGWSAGLLPTILHFKTSVWLTTASCPLNGANIRLIREIRG
jgi:hypothetical protein